jgi:cytidyltransferase-like protein
MSVMPANQVLVTGGFDNLRSRHVRFLEEASRQGPVHVLLWPDEAIAAFEGQPPKFSLSERLYLLRAVRYVDRATVAEGGVRRDELPGPDWERPAMWAVLPEESNELKRAFCATRGLGYRVVSPEVLERFPARPAGLRRNPGHKRVLVTGCYDWLHSGHVRFFEEVSQLGDLYVVVGHDSNVRYLKGEGHPLFGEEERRYMAEAIRFVTQALISSGNGWLDAEPEIALVQPHAYAVNEDGDKPEKRAFCETHGIEYVVLKRTPKEGLPRRESTALRGF